MYIKRVAKNKYGWSINDLLSFTLDSVENVHPVLDMNDDKIIEKEYKNNARKRKIGEGHLIKEMNLTWNKKDDLVGLKLFI